MLSDEELKEIEDAERDHQIMHERAGALCETCLPSGCDAVEGHIPKLLAEVKRLRQLVYAHDTTGAPECYAIDPPPIKRES